MICMKKILNLWCGKWQNVPQLLSKWVVYNVDIDQKSVDSCLKKYPNTVCICLPAEDLDFSDWYFDEIYAFDILEHVYDIDSVMKKVFDMLNPDWLLYVEVPNDVSENMLLKVNPSYHKEIWHVRIFDYDSIDETFLSYWFKILKKDKSRWIVNLYLWACFKSWIHITDQMCTMTWPKRYLERLYFAISIRFDKNLFNTWLKWIPIWIFTMPIWRILSELYPKTTVLYLKKNNEI